MANEDFTTYTKVDPGSVLTITAPKIIYTAVKDTTTTYVYADKGAGFFTGNFSHNFDFQWNSDTGGDVYAWAMANALNDWKSLQTASASGIAIYAGATNLFINEINGGSGYNGSVIYGMTVNTTYYCTVRRNTAVGTNGTLYLDVYSDSGRTTLLTSSNLALHANTNFRYMYGMINYNNGNNVGVTGYTENLNLSVTTDSTISVTDTIAFAESEKANNKFTITDTISFLEVIKVNLKATYIDTIAFAESIKANLKATYTDSISFLESIKASISMKWTDTISLLESLTIALQISIAVTDTIAFVEKMTASLSIKVIDTISFLESLIVSLKFKIKDTISFVENLILTFKLYLFKPTNLLIDNIKPKIKSIIDSIKPKIISK